MKMTYELFEDICEKVKFKLYDYEKDNGFDIISLSADYVKDIDERNQEVKFSLEYKGKDDQKHEDSFTYNLKEKDIPSIKQDMFDDVIDLVCC
jgi:predicted secreted protein